MFRRERRATHHGRDPRDGVCERLAGHSPLRVTRDEATQTTVVEMSASRCASCPLLTLCPIHQTPEDRFELNFTDKARRTAARRCEAETNDTPQSERLERAAGLGLGEAARDGPRGACQTAGCWVGLDLWGSLRRTPARKPIHALADVLKPFPLHPRAHGSIVSISSSSPRLSSVGHVM